MRIQTTPPIAPPVQRAAPTHIPSNLILCPDCQRSISRNAKSCPSCGRVMKKEGQSAGGVLAAIIIGLILAYFVIRVATA